MSDQPPDPSKAFAEWDRTRPTFDQPTDADVAPDPSVPVDAWKKVKRHSTREIVQDYFGDKSHDLLRGPRRFGHNPSWIKAADVDAALATERQQHAAFNPEVARLSGALCASELMREHLTAQVIALTEARDAPSSERWSG